MRTFVIAGVGSMLALPGCGADWAGLEDPGNLCVLGADDQPNTHEVALEAGSPVRFHVTAWPECYNDGEIETSCSLQRDGDTFVVETTILYERGHPICWDDIGAPTEIDCETEPLPEGSYEVVYADRRSTFSVPHVGEATCVRGND